jgi:hypothetical protein
MVVRWRTAMKTTSVVRYGPTPDRLEQIAASPGRLREHVVLVSGLKSETHYFYSIGTTNQALQSGPEYYFDTSPPADATNSIRVWVLGDPGTDYPEQRAVRDAYYALIGPMRTDVTLALGDNAYPRGTDWQYQSAFFEIYRELFRHCAVWPAMGNHDSRSANSDTESGAYYQIFTLPRQAQAGGAPSGTEAYYSFDYGNTHFICLNSDDSDRSTNGPMLTWLKRDLQTNGKTWTIAYWHHCPYTKGSHDSDEIKDNDTRMVEMRENALPLLEAAGVDLVLCGHTHCYERSFLLHGHYGKSSSLQPQMVLDKGDGRADGSGAYHKIRGRLGSGPGTVYVNTGSAGHATRPTALHGLNHPAMCLSYNVPGSVVLNINGTRLDSMFLDGEGVALDHFSFIKDVR